MTFPYSEFCCLDDLITLIYHENVRFVLLSSVETNEWVLHLGLVGKGRWWSASWDDEEIRGFLGNSASSDELLELAEKLVDNFINEKVSVSGWSTETTAKIKLIFGDTDKRCVIRLNEMSTQDAATYATVVFSKIAMQAQSRKCQLDGASSGVPVDVGTVATSSKSGNSGGSSQKTKSQKAAEQPVPSKKRKGRREETPEMDSKTEPKVKAIPKAMPKGASLANPTKKARKYQAVQFESDEE